MKLTIDDCKKYLEKLDKLVENNEWMVSPHAITPYIEFLEYQEQTEEIEELYDKLLDHRCEAYEY